jgi:hypothetical protein
MVCAEQEQELRESSTEASRCHQGTSFLTQVTNCYSLMRAPFCIHHIALHENANINDLLPKKQKSDGHILPFYCIAAFVLLHSCKYITASRITAIPAYTVLHSFVLLHSCREKSGKTHAIVLPLQSHQP